MILFESLDFPHVRADRYLAIERMSKAHIDILPVVKLAVIRRLEGTVTLRDALDRTAQTLLASRNQLFSWICS